MAWNDAALFKTWDPRLMWGGEYFSYVLCGLCGLGCGVTFSGGGLSGMVVGIVPE